MTDSQATLHYAPNGNFVNGTYTPGADGFNLADVSPSGVSSLPAGVKGLVWVGNTIGGATATFQAIVNGLVGNPNVYGFFLADEPSDGNAVNLKAESDYIHAHDPGAKTFIVELNNGPDSAPQFSYNPANTGIDLYGIDPYPIQSFFAGGADYSIIGSNVHAAEAQGIPQSQIVPFYQAFGNVSQWVMPTASQEQTILSTWGSFIPTPAFDAAYSWGVQGSDTALVNDPTLQQVFATHNAGTAIPSPPPPPPPTPPQIGPDHLALLLSEDRFGGDAQFIAKVDGAQIAGPTAVTTQHSSGQSETFNYAGMWPSGAHDLEIDFINDRSNGKQDRDLYVDQVKYDGASYLSQSIPLLTNSAAHIQLNDSTN